MSIKKPLYNNSGIIKEMDTAADKTVSLGAQIAVGTDGTLYFGLLTSLSDQTPICTPDGVPILVPQPVFLEST